MDYDDLIFRIGPDDGPGHRLDVVARSGERDSGFLDLALLPPEALARLAAPGKAGWPEPLELGRRLAQALLPGSIRELYQRSRGQAQATGRGLRIRIRGRPSLDEREGLGAIFALPWELLRPDDDFLALSRETPIVRDLEVARPSHVQPRRERLRILAVMAEPADRVSLNLDAEWDALATSWRGRPDVELVPLRNPTLDRLREKLDEGEGFDVLHFMGHGGFEPARAEWVLYLIDGHGSSDPVPASLLAAELADFRRPLRLVVLNACRTARSSPGSAGNPAAIGVAMAMVEAGLMAVVAMQANISDNAAIEFSQGFYQRLAAGDAAERAMAVSRKRLHALERHGKVGPGEWATPVLFLRADQGQIFEAPRADPPATPPPAKILAKAWQRFGPLTLAIALGIGVVGLVLAAVLLRARADVLRVAIPELSPASPPAHPNVVALPGLLRQKALSLGPTVLVVCSACPGLLDEIRTKVEPDFTLLVLPSPSGVVVAEIYDRRGVLRTPVRASYLGDPTETLGPLADGLLATLAAEGFVPDPAQLRTFRASPTLSAEALELNNEATIAIHRAAALGDPSGPLLDQAREKLRQALELDPRFAAALANQAWLDELAGQIPQAAAGYRQASELGKSYPPFFFQWGRFLLYAGAGLEANSLDLAIGALERATTLDPTYWQAFNELGNARLRRGTDADARRALEQALVYVPGEQRWVVLKNLGRAELRLGATTAARRDLEEARQTPGLQGLQLAEIDYHLAVLHERRSDRGLACRSLAAARSNDPAEAIPLLDPELQVLEKLRECDLR